MTRLGSATAIGLLLSALASQALAKGLEPAEARITGPGLEKPIVLRDPDGPGGTGGTTLGLFAGQTLSYSYEDRSRMVQKPAEDLGPRYTVHWRLRPMEGGDTVTLRQDLFPYAQGGPVVFLPDSRRARRSHLTSGWLRPTPTLLTNLQAYGLPERAPGSASSLEESGDETEPSFLAPIAGTGSIALVGLGVFFVMRRRSGPAAHPAR